MLKKIVALTLFVLFSSIHLAMANEWIMDKKKSSLDFQIAAEGTTIIGSFKEFDTRITLNPDDTSTAKVSAPVKTSSLSAGDSTVDVTALSGSWLSQKEFPTVTYTSTKIEKKADGNYEMTGDLNIKGITKSITIPFSLKIKGDEAHAAGSVTLERALFNLGATGDAAPTILVKLSIYATRK